MRCISPFDNESYHMGTIRTNNSDKVEKRLSAYNATAQLFYDSYLFTCIGQPSVVWTTRVSFVSPFNFSPFKTILLNRPMVFLLVSSVWCF